jgi:integrase/recombinase XerC
MSLLEQAIRKFTIHMEVERNLTPNTRNNYLSDIRQFQKFLTKNYTFAEDSGVDTLMRVDHMMIRAFLGSLYRGKMKKVTISRKVTTLRTFFNYLLREGMVKNNPAEMIQAPRVEKYIPAFLSVDEMLALLKADGGTGAMAFRDRAIIELFYSSGIRLGELVGLNMVDIDFIQGLIKVRGKGRKERVVPVGDPALGALREYLENRREVSETLSYGGSKDPVFVGKSDARLSARTVARILDKMVLMSGLKRKISPHVLRHTFATWLVQDGVSIYEVQKLLGHSSIEMTQVYSHLHTDQLHSAVNKLTLSLN